MRRILTTTTAAAAAHGIFQSPKSGFRLESQTQLASLPVLSTCQCVVRLSRCHPLNFKSAFCMVRLSFAKIGPIQDSIRTKNYVKFRILDSFRYGIAGSPDRACSDRAAWCVTLKSKKAPPLSLNNFDSLSHKT